MIVGHILADKGSDVITIEPERTLADAALLLAERRLGAVVVADAESPVRSIISERDVARAVARRGAAALQEPVSQHMTTKLFTCTRACTVSQIMEIMTDQKERLAAMMRRSRSSTRRGSRTVSTMALASRQASSALSKARKESSRIMISPSASHSTEHGEDIVCVARTGPLAGP